MSVNIQYFCVAYTNGFFFVRRKKLLKCGQKRYSREIIFYWKKKLFALGGKCPGLYASFGLRSQGYNYGNFALPNARTEFSLTLSPLLTFIGLKQTLESQVMSQSSNLSNTTQLSLSTLAPTLEPWPNYRTKLDSTFQRIKAQAFRVCLQLKQTRRRWKQERHLKMKLCVSAVIFQLFKIITLENCVLTILELNWNQRLGHKKTKLNICHHMLTSSTQLQNWSFHVVERTKMSNVKCEKNEICTCKACKNTIFHYQICKFVGFLLPSSSWLLKLPIIIGSLRSTTRLQRNVAKNCKFKFVNIFRHYISLCNF